MKPPARDSNWRHQRLEARTLTATPPSPLEQLEKIGKRLDKIEVKTTKRLQINQKLKV